jgi:ABC-type multidrug transport system fused ATPase/permease subunit
MSGRHQQWICRLPGATPTLTAVPQDQQRRIVDDVIADGDLALQWWLAALYLAVLLVQGAAKYVLHMYQGWLSESAIRYNRAHLTRIYERHNNAAEGNVHSGEAVSIIGAEIDRLGGFVGEGLSQPVVNGGMLLAIIGYMLVIEPQVALISMVFVLPQILLMPVLQHRINVLMARRVSMMRGFGDRLTELPEAEADFNGSDMPERLDHIFDNRVRTFLWKFGQKAAVNLLNGVAPLSVLLVGGLMVIEGETTIGVVVAFISGFDRMSTPLRELIAYYRIAAQASVQHRMIARWM